MLKRTRKKEIRSVVVFDDTYFCDRCGAAIENLDYKDTGDNLFSSHFEIKTGYRFSDSFSFDYKEAHFCCPCAEQIKDMLEENGVVFTDRNESN